MASRTVPPLLIPTPVSSWKKALLMILGGFFALFILSALLFATLQPIKVLPRVRLAPGFALIDQNGEILTNEDLRGQIILYNFTYTRCPAPCANMNTTMQAIQDKVEMMGLDGISFTLVTISFDPKYDTPEVLQAYATSQGADPARWHFATLNNPTLLKTIVGGGFEAYYEQQPDESFDFSPTYVLVDGWGIVRGQYRYETLASDVDRISRHVGVLAEEVQKSTGANRLVYEAAHLFLCYAP
ncbi:MAG TPA: SCO family protein [Anaerolineales bacterium]|nr:SCO family protein [Anaerolineales bacterium]